MAFSIYSIISSQALLHPQLFEISHPFPLLILWSTTTFMLMVMPSFGVSNWMVGVQAVSVNIAAKIKSAVEI